MELFVKYTSDSPQERMLYDWATNHKTMIVLNGGFLSDMQEALGFFERPENPYPMATFYESEEALGGILTNIAIVLPEKIYKTSEFIRKRYIDGNLNVDPKLHITVVDTVEETLAGFGEFSQFEIELCSFMNNFRMA
jgi:hypothetical protein